MKWNQWIILATCMLTQPVWADVVTEQMDEALKAYQAKDYQAAVDALRYATQQIQKKQSEANQTLLPEPLKGWKAEKGDDGMQQAMAMMGGGTGMQRIYTKGKQKVHITIVAGSPMISAMAMMINNPMMMSSDGAEPYRYKRIKGVKKKDSRSTEISLLIAGQILLQLEGERLSDEAVLRQYLDNMDIEKVKQALLSQ